jgi:NUMOD3 motif
MGISKKEFDGLVARVALLEASIAAIDVDAVVRKEVHRAKLSQAMKGNKNAQGHKQTPSQRRKISLAMRGNQNAKGRYKVKE